MSEVKAEYRVTTDAGTHGRECYCPEPCGELQGYFRHMGNWIVLLTVDGYLLKGDAWLPPCPKCGKQRQFIEVLRNVPAFVDPHREREREEKETLLEDARELAKIYRSMV